MNIVIIVKKVGNHWYPNLEHDDPSEIALSPKIDRLLTLLDKDHLGELHFVLSEVHSWLSINTIQFDDDDIWRYLNTNDDFDLTIYIGDHEFEVSSSLIDLFESQFNTNFHKNLYNIYQDII